MDACCVIANEKSNQGREPPPSLNSDLYTRYLPAVVVDRRGFFRA